MKIEFTTDNIALCPADVQFSPNTVACNPEHTGDVLIAVANGMFGFVEETASKDCSATCLYSAVNTFSYRWNDNTMCWDKLSGYSSCNQKDKHERNAAKLHKSSLCTMSAPPTIEVELPGGAETAPEPEVEIDMPCTQVRNELTLDFMDGLCGHEEPCNPIDGTCISNTGANRGPTAVGCDPEDTHSVLLSLANGLFGGNSGNERNCGAHCLFDYITPFNTAYKWDSMSMCWSRKKGNTDKCGGATERDYAVGRQSSLCPPTQAPTLSPSFTMSPTKQPTDSPTTSTPTVSPSVSPTSSSPTAFPTTSKPTVSPTMSPSLSPTPSPTGSPTVYCIQFNHSLSTDIVQEFCGESIECQGDSCKSELGAEFGPDARACSEKDQDRLELSIANGMFGGADGQARNCDSFCVWDHLKPKKRSYKWDGKKQCWKRKNAKCYANDKAEKVFAFDRRELFCTVKDADQQIDNGEDTDVVDDTKRHHRVRLATVAYDAKLTKPVLGVAVFGFTITLSAIGAVVMSRRRTSQRTLIAAQETAV